MKRDLNPIGYGQKLIFKTNSVVMRAAKKQYVSITLHLCTVGQWRCSQLSDTFWDLACKRSLSAGCFAGTVLPLVSRRSDLRFMVSLIQDMVAFPVKKLVHGLGVFLDPGLPLDKLVAAGAKSSCSDYIYY